ncbi:MAG: hypothetical protein ABR978_01170 [Dehalococcoidia bacterium]|jgi:hypothetical protein
MTRFLYLAAFVLAAAALAVTACDVAQPGPSTTSPFAAATPTIAAAASPSPAPTLPSSACVSVNGLPDPACTPGAIDLAVTQDNIQQTVCVAGYTQTVRPPVSYTTPLKILQMALYGWTGPRSDYEEDHLISLELGGHPRDPKNLWPEPYNVPQGARQKDQIENLLHDRVCSGQITLREAQTQIATNWEAVQP